MKNLLIGSACLLILSTSLVGCQTYPKEPVYPKTWGQRYLVNNNIPDELRPYELPPKVGFLDKNRLLPRQIIVTKPMSPVIQPIYENTVTSAEVTANPVVTPVIVTPGSPVTVSPVEGVNHVEK